MITWALEACFISRTACFISRTTDVRTSTSDRRDPSRGPRLASPSRGESGDDGCAAEGHRRRRLGCHAPHCSQARLVVHKARPTKHRHARRTSATLRVPRPGVKAANRASSPLVYRRVCRRRLFRRAFLPPPPSPPPHRHQDFLPPPPSPTPLSCPPTSALGRPRRRHPYDHHPDPPPSHHPSATLTSTAAAT